jgi:hypothetical protein
MSDGVDFKSTNTSKWLAALSEWEKMVKVGCDFLTFFIYLAGSVVSMCCVMYSKHMLKFIKLCMVFAYAWLSKEKHITLKALSVSEILEIIKNLDSQPCVMYAKVMKQLSTPVSTIDNTTINKKNILQQSGSTQIGKKFKNF